MKSAFNRFYDGLSQAIPFTERVVIAILSLGLIMAFVLPMWHIHMQAPQYPEGLEIGIYAYKLEGGHQGRDIAEINTLNHYVGMAPIDRAQMADLDWIPFALGALLILALRVAVVGNLRSLIDLVVVTSYFGLFSFARFSYRMYWLGHHLNPEAPFKMAGFTPAILGSKQVYNFVVSSMPGWGSLGMAAFAVGTAVIAGRLIWATRLEAK